jgi:hypothetical protein
MLLGNIASLLRSPGRFFGGTTLSCERANFNNPGDERNLFVGSAGISPTGGQPNGVRHPYTWTMPKGPGGMATYENALGTGSVSAGNLAGGKNADADLTGMGEVLSATGQLIVSALASLSGTGTVSDAALLAFLNALADLSAGGDMDGTIDALGWQVASLAGSGTAALTPYATGTLSSDIVTGEAVDLTPESIAAAVWEALTSSYTSAGTMGKALQDASAAGNPWAAELVSNNDAGTFGERLQKLLTTGKFMALK